MNIGFRHFFKLCEQEFEAFLSFGTGTETSKLHFVLSQQNIRHLSGSTMFFTIGNYHSIIYQGANIKVKKC